VEAVRRGRAKRHGVVVYEEWRGPMIVHGGVACGGGAVVEEAGCLATCIFFLIPV
jgi:hypothetical protein